MDERIKILYVDDEPDILNSGRQFLERGGDFQVTLASGAADALNLLSTHHFDLILSDYQMPKMNGLELLEHLRTAGNYTPYILFTGKGREDIVIEALNTGADFYLEKGDNPKTLFSELTNIIRHIVLRKRAEYELQETQKQLADIIDFLPDATVAINNDGMVIAWNKAMEVMTGISKEAMIGEGDHVYTIPFYGDRRKHLLDLLDVDEQELALRYTNIRKTGQTLSAEAFTPALYNGKGAYLWGTASPLFDSQGVRIGAIESIRDITDRIQIEEELRRKNLELEKANEANSLSRKTLEERERRLQVLSDNLPNGMVYQLLIEPDGTRTFIHVSGGVKRLHGLTAEEIQNNPSLLYEQIYEEDRMRFFDAENKAIQQLSSFTIEARFIDPGGIIRWGLVRSIPRQMPGGTILWDGIEIDITDIKNIEISLKETNDFLESLISIANVPILVWDTSFQITRLNHACEELIGRTAKEVLGTPLHLLFPPGEAERSLRLLQTTQDGVRWETTECNMQHKDGTIRTLVWNSATLYSPDGTNPIATIAQGQDITREKILEKERDNALSQIKQNLAHLAILNDEIRNPLSIILAFVDLTDNQQIIDNIVVQIQRIDTLVSQLDKRWVESEKILDYIRKHHHISITPVIEAADSIAGYKPDTLKDRSSDKIRTLLIEEVQAQLYTILDSIDSLIYVADMDTYDLLYINQRGRNIFGSSIGKKCHHFLNDDQDTPCSFCTNQILRENHESQGLYHWVYQNPRNKRWYDCRDRIIRWTDGRLVRLEIATDVTKQKQMVQSLAQETSLLAQAETIAHMGSWRISLLTGAVTWSDEMYRIYGLTKEDFYPDTERILKEYTHHDDQEQVKNLISEIMQDGIPREFEYRIVRPDGTVLWVHNQGEIEYDETGKALSIAGFLQDITVQRQAERELRNSENKFATVFKSNPIALTLVSISDGLFTDVNDAFLRNTGYTREEVIGKNALEIGLFPQKEEYIRLSTDLRKNHAVFGLELHCRRKTGEVDIGRFSSKVIFIDEKPQIISTIENITEVKQAQFRLQESELRYKVISEIATDFQFSCIKNADSGYTIEWMTGSVEDITGYSIDEMKEMGCWRNIVHQDDRPIFDEEVINVPEGEVRECSVRILSKDDNIKWLLVHTTKVRDMGMKHSDHLFGGCRDITTLKLTEEKLRESEETYRKLVHNVPDYILVHRNGTILFVNDTGANEMGYSRDEIIGNNIGKFLTNESQALVREMMKQRFSGNILPSYEITILTKDNTPKIVEVRGVLIQYEGGPAALNVLTDITERKRVLEELQQSENRFRQIINAIQVGIFIVDVKTHTILEVNQKARDMIEATQNEIIGSVCHQFVCPAEVGNCPITDLGHNVDSSERILLTKDKTRKPVLKTVIKTALSGREVLIESIVDISDRKKIEEALRTSEIKHRQLVNNAHDAIVVAQGRKLLLVNPRMSDLTGYSETELLSMPYTELLHPDDQTIVTERHDRRRKGENIPSRHIFRIMRKDGNTIWIEMSSVLIEWEGETATLNFLTDVTERKQAEDALKESNKKLRLLTSLTRHDIFNQLAAIDMFQNMAMESSDIEQIHNHIRHARMAGERIETIIGFTRQYEDFGIVSSRWESITQVIDDALKEIVLEFIHVKTSIPDDIEIYADPIIRKVFTTLMENAVRHGKKITEIRFFSQETNNGLVIMCEDDGVGIPVDEKERIFDHGYGSHTGIGLFLARAILSITGLTIREVGEQGKGACFEIHIPIEKYRRKNPL